MDTDATERRKTNIFAGVSILREKEAKQTPEEAARRKQMQDYLKKYEGNGGEQQKKKKRKKKKRPEATTGAIQIIDNDLTGFSKALEEPEPERIDEDEFAPVIANVEEAERAMRLVKEAGQQRSWRLLDNAAGCNSVDEASPPRRASSRHDSDDDASPPRRGARRHDSEDDAFPPRRDARRHDSDDDASPPRRDAPRHDSDDDVSPPRRGASRHDSDGDASPPRRKVAHHDSNDDASPPRRPGGREGSDEDASPPRRPAGRVKNASPSSRRVVRDGSDDDASPPRRPVAARDSDASPPRRGSDGKAPAVGGSSAARRPASMADGTKAGLVEASEITREMKKKAEVEEKKWRELGRERTGKGVETVYRDKRGQRTSKEGYEEGKRKARHRSRWEEEPITWKQGLAQQRAQQLVQQRMATEGSKPFAAGYDEELNREQQEELRADDPMLQFVRKAQRVEDLAPSLLAGPNADLLRKSGFVIPQEVPPHSWLRRGAIAPQNRFSIKPGRHWDGVDRSTGFEKGLFVQMNQKVAAAKEARKYAMEADDL